jgi:integral membrane sensor domain MASE1
MPSETAEASPPAPAPNSDVPPGFLARWGTVLIGIPVLAAVYAVAGKLGLTLAVLNESATTIWPPTGIALAACLIFGVRLWPGVFVGALIVNLTTSGSWPASIGIAVGNTAEAVVGCLLVDRYANGRRAFERTRDVFRFTLLAAVLSTTMSATWGVASLVLSGAASGSDFGAIWLTWWLGDLGGDLIIAPFLILWSSRSSLRWNMPDFLEGALLLAVLFLLSSALFGGLLPFSARSYAIGFLCIPVVLWSSFRFGPRNTAAVLVLLSAVALSGTLRWFGSFSPQAKNETLLFLQAFLGVISITALTLSAAVEERRRATEALQQKLAEVARLNLTLDQQKEELGAYHDLLSHDISNFAMALLGLVERLLLQADGPLTRKQEELIRRSNRQVLEMNRMAENARTLARVREQGLPAPGGPVYIREVLNRAVELVRDLHFDRPFESSVECPSDAKLVGMPLLDSILVNLLDNAVRHNPKGTKPELKVRVLPTEDRVVIEIQGGVPPPKESIEQLFKRETRIGRSSGHGIGLILVREILQRAEGTIAAKTVRGDKGELFEVSVSLRAA